MVASIAEIDVYGRILRMNPLWLFGWSWIVGWALLLWSLHAGIGVFNAMVEIGFSDPVSAMRTTLPLGYAQQLNYGPWYVLPVFCPAVFLFAGLAAEGSAKSCPKSLTECCSLIAIARRPLIRVTGLGIFLASIWMSEFTEFRDYKNLALGWVQAEAIQRAKNEIERTGKPFPVTGKRFRYYDIKDDHVRVGDSVEIVEVVPKQFHVRNHNELIAFIGIAKLYAGIWEGLIVYLALLCGVLGRNLYRSLSESSASAQDSRYGIGWTDRTVIPLLLISLLVNVFWVLRVFANMIKGSFGAWDQYASLITLSPATVLVVTGLMMAYRTFNLEPAPNQQLSTNHILALVGLWIMTLAFLAYLIVGNVDPYTRQGLGQLIEAVKSIFR